MHQREYDAVHTALERTLQLPDGAERARLVSMVFGTKSHTIDETAQVLHVSWRIFCLVVKDFVFYKY